MGAVVRKRYPDRYWMWFHNTQHWWWWVCFEEHNGGMPLHAQSQPLCAQSHAKGFLFCFVLFCFFYSRVTGGVINAQVRRTRGGRKGTSVISSLSLSLSLSLFLFLILFSARAALGKVKGAPVTEEKSAW